jgi:hypothetical protein
VPFASRKAHSARVQRFLGGIGGIGNSGGFVSATGMASFFHSIASALAKTRFGALGWPGRNYRYAVSSGMREYPSCGGV